MYKTFRNLSLNNNFSFDYFKLSNLKTFSRLTSSISSSNDSKHVIEQNKKILDNSKPTWVPFWLPKYGSFTQEKPQLKNQFIDDAFLQKYLQRILPEEVYNEVTPDLIQFGHRVATDINDLGRECDTYLPKLIVHDAWGKTVNKLHTCQAWEKQHDIVAQQGLVAIAYERKFNEWSRLYQLTKLYLYFPSSGLYSCPLSMTDAAAKTIEALNLKSQPFYRDVYEHLISRDPNNIWTSGQWMTEKGGGSDVAGGTETVAVYQTGDMYRLYGYKWFTSATDSNIAITLARIADQEGNVIQGTRGLTLFFIKLRDDQGNLNNINMIRLKDKLGTRQVPTAEILLDGTLGYKISEEGRGVSAISNMLQLTRVHNAIGGAAYMRRIISIAKDYAHKRKAFGKPISQYPIHMHTLANMDCEAKGSFILAFEVARLLGREECKIATDEESLILRLLIPISKLYVCKQSINVVSEGLESIGGQGVMEDTGFPVLLRDSQIFVIWEGTTNVLSLDVVRSIGKTGGEVLKAFKSNVKKRLDYVAKHASVIGKDEALKIENKLDQIIKIVQNNPAVLEFGARDFSFSLAKIFIASTFLEISCMLGSTTLDEFTALRWCQGQDIAPFLTNYHLNYYNSNSFQTDYKIVMENYKIE